MDRREEGLDRREDGAAVLCSSSSSSAKLRSFLGLEDEDLREVATVVAEGVGLAVVVAFSSSSSGRRRKFLVLELLIMVLQNRVTTVFSLSSLSLEHQR